MPKPRKHTVLIEFPRNHTNQKQMVATNPPELIVSSHTDAVNSPASSKCSLCDVEKHLLYACPKFKSLPHEVKLSVLKNNKLCSNCLHFWRQCTSIHKCKVCQKPHHMLQHLGQPNISSTPTTVTILVQSATTQDGAPTGLHSEILLP